MVPAAIWILVSAAPAQEEVCHPYSTAQWQAELGVAQQAFDALRVDRARAVLREVERQLRCLDEVATPTDVARHARVQAQRAMFDMDPVGFEGWIRTAQALDPEGVWPVPADHPLWRFVSGVGPSEVRGPKGRWPAHPKRGGVFLDGAFLDNALAMAEAPHLLQVFDGDEQPLFVGFIDGASFPERWLTDAPVPEPPPRWWTGADAAQTPAQDLGRWAAARKDTAEAYEAYLRREPTGVFAAEARRRLDDKVWEVSTGTVDEATAYLERFPRGRHAAEAHAVLERANLRAALAVGTRDALRGFLARHPTGLATAAATERLDDLAWRDAADADTPEAYARYRLQWPRGGHRTEARVAHEQATWDRVLAVPTPTHLQAYLDAWPRGIHVDAARAALAVGTLRQVWLTVETPEGWDVADQFAATLVALADDRGVEVTHRADAPDRLAARTAWWKVTVQASAGASVQLDATAEVHVPGFSAPVRTERVQATVFDGDPDAGRTLARYLDASLD